MSTVFASITYPLRVCQELPQFGEVCVSAQRVDSAQCYDQALIGRLCHLRGWAVASNHLALGIY